MLFCEKSRIKLTIKTKVWLRNGKLHEEGIYGLDLEELMCVLLAEKSEDIPEFGNDLS